MLLVLVGCGPAMETAKILWGSSTRALEAARSNAFRRDFSCDLDACYKETLKIAELEKWEIFIKKRKEPMIVVMGIKGAVETTEVGIFFKSISAGRVEIAVTSLSTNAKRTAAETLFAELANTFPEP